MRTPSPPALVRLVFVVIATSIASPAQILTTLHSFAGSPNDGAVPYAKLARGTDGNFYGTTHSGGANGDGTVFKMTPSGTVTILHSFTGQGDGTEPTAGLIQASDGNFYGTTGGDSSGNCQAGDCGTVFKITASGGLTTLHVFRPGQGDGGYPSDALVQGSDGNFYGTTYGGGTASCGCGTVFKITSNGTVTILYSFTGESGGEQPSAGLIRATDGNFYGTTHGGGSDGYGTVFKITPSGTLTTLHNFSGSDGRNPQAGLVQATDGNFYGTTNGGGANGNGTAFKITSSGTLTTLHSFDGSDGNLPSSTLVQAMDGNFYGTTYNGGANSEGTIFKITPTGTLTTLYSFAGSDGANPDAGLMQATDGSFYGTTVDGGSSGYGTVFQLQLVSYTLTVNPPTGQGTVTSSDGYINCPGTCTHSYPEDSQVTLMANPAQGWNLESWGGACSGNNPTCTVTMSNNETVSATFQQSFYTLTVSVSGQGSITSTDGLINCPGTCSHSYLSFTQVTLNASPGSGWDFAGWSGACTGTGSCQLTMLGNYGVSAYFNEPGHGVGFVPVAPCRLLDTRQTGNPIQGGTFQSFDIAQLSEMESCGIPTGAAAYSLNVTVVPRGRLGYLTVWPAGLAEPVTSLLNSDGRTKAVAAIVQAGTSDSISVYASQTTDLILDINGYFKTTTGQTLQFYPLTPCRVIDTRGADGSLGGPALVGMRERDFPVLDSSCIPQNANIQAYSFNVTVSPNPQNQAMSYLTVWPQGGSRPTVSTLNNYTATRVANAAIVPAGDNGEIAVFPSQSTDLIVDINGYFAPAGTGGLSLYATAPCRVLDTRNGNGAFSGTLVVNVESSPCMPSSAAKTYVFNATVIPTAQLGYLTLWPDGDPMPTASTLNASDGAITSNMAIVPTSNGKVDAYAPQPTQLILDISSYFAP